MAALLNGLAQRERLAMCDWRLAISEVFAALPTFLAQALIDASLFTSLFAHRQSHIAIQFPTLQRALQPAHA
jgi:hypothetical protein